MKFKQISIFVSLFLFLMPLGLFAQIPDSVTGKEQISIKEPAHDFGKIKQGLPVFHDFQFTNTSAAPLNLDNVQASCGCTTPEWGRGPIAPGRTAAIKVGYNAAAPGFFEKTITVTYGEGKTAVLTIKGTVWAVPEQPAPFNKSIALLKTVKF